jgi:hypothetical protein
MEVLIPEEWKRVVVGILRSGDAARILMRESARLAWEATFPCAWNYDLYGAITAALSDARVTGRHIKDMDEPGETYSFWFYYEGRKLYGKICLTPSQEILILYSAHPPRKGDEKL